MAAEVTARHNKHPTIAFTLPISCQVCLGKVKNPVLCPNNHVFCATCMEICLEKNKHCPACNVSMASSKQIMGGLSQYKEDGEKLNNADFRKARFEILYKEYENEFERMQSEIQLLWTENHILKQQTRITSSSKLGGSNKSTDSSHLLTLTKKLQEVTKQYEKLKEDLTKFKQENTNLKDENLSLNRENQNLRQEVAGCAIQRFGRTTASALETKLANAEKDVTRLTKALERSDNYIEELEKELQIYREKSESSKNYKSNKDDKYHTNEDLGNKKSDFKVPPAKEYSVGADNPSRRQLFAEDKGSKSSTAERSKYNYESNGDNGVYTSEQSSNKTSKTSNILNGKKKVTFDLEKNTNTTSFDLELPSPLKQSGNSNSLDSGRVSPTKGVLKKSNYKHNASDKSSDGFSSDMSKTLDDSLSDSYNVKHKENNSKEHDLLNFNSRLPASDRNYNDAYTKLNRKYGAGNGAEESFLSVPSDIDSVKLGADNYNSKRSYNYDLDRRPAERNTKLVDLDPRMSLGDRTLDRYELDDTQYIESELDELNISLTPEFTDCMKILNRAEKKVNTRDISPLTDAFSTYISGDVNDMDNAFRASTGSIGYKSGLGEQLIPDYKSDSNKFTSSLNSYSDSRHVRSGSLDNLLVNKLPVDKYYQSSSAIPSNIHSLATQSKYTGGLTTGRTKLTRTPSLDNLLSQPTSTGYGSKYSILPARSGVPNYLDPAHYGENKNKVDVKSSTGGGGHVTSVGSLVFPAKHDSSGGSDRIGSIVSDTYRTLDPALEVQSKSLAVTDGGYSTRISLESNWKLPPSGRQTSTLAITVPISSTGAATDLDKHYISGKVTPTIPTHSEYMALSRSTDKTSYSSALSRPTVERYMGPGHTTTAPLTDYNPSTKTSSSLPVHINQILLTNYNPSTKTNPNYSEQRCSELSSLLTELSQKPPAGPRQSEFSEAQTNLTASSTVPTISAYTNTDDGYHSMPTNTISNFRTGVRDQLDGRQLSSAEYDIQSDTNKYSNFVPSKTNSYNVDKLDLIGSANYRSGDLYSANNNMISGYNDHNYKDGTDFSNFSTKVAVSSNHDNYPFSMPSASLAANVLSASSAGPSLYSLGPSSSSYPGSSSYLTTTLPSKNMGFSYSTAHNVPLTYPTSSYTSSIPTNTYTSIFLDPIKESGQYSYVSNVSADYSSKNDTFALPEPKKRLFESSDDLDMSVSPIKANRRF